MVRTYLILLLISINLFANVFLKSSDYYIENEPFTFEIEVIGENINFPQIDNIDGNVVQNLGTARTITSINGNVKNIMKKSFRLIPNGDFTIPSFDIEVDGKTFKTDSKNITKRSVSKTVSNDYSFFISLSNNELYVGQSAVLTMKFAHRRDLQIIDLSLSMPKYKDIWIKKLDKQRSYEEGDYSVQEVNYLLYPQKSGKLRLSPAKVIAKIIDGNFNSFTLFQPPTKDINVYSNSLEFDVKDLPKDVKLIGEFIINSEVSTNEVNENEPVSYKIKIDGFGNIDDLEDLKLNIKGATVFENKPKIEKKFVNDKEVISYEKSFSIISSRDFMIPEFEIKFLDENIKKVVTQKTKSYDIKVNAKQNLEKPKLEKEIEKKEVTEKIVYVSSTNDKIIFFILGIVVSLLIFGLFNFVKNRDSKTKEDRPLAKKIKESKTKESLLKILVPFVGKEKELDELIFKLEKLESLDIKEIKKDIIKQIEVLKI